MSVFETLTALLEGSAQRTPGNAGSDGSAGSYWCDDCGVRVRDVEVDGTTVKTEADGTPSCPDCGAQMRFERASGTGCAC